MSVRMGDFKEQTIGVMGDLRVVASNADDFAAISFDGSHAGEAVAVGLVGMTGIDYISEANGRWKEISRKAQRICSEKAAITG